MWLYTVIRTPLSYIAKFPKETIVKIQNIVSTGFEGMEAIAIDKFKNIDQIDLVSKLGEYVSKHGTSDFAGLDLDFSKIPNFNLFGVNLAETPSFNLIGKGPEGWLVLIPILAAVSSWLSMFLMRKWNNNPASTAADAQSQASMKMMDLMMPAMSLFIAFSFSGMLGVYWIYQSAISILQSFILSRVMPMPTFTEEELKNMQKAQKAAEKAQKEALKAQPKVRSLHYIDADDYDELPEMKNPPKPTKKNAGIEAPQIKD